MAAATYIDTVQQFYIAYYGRPADPAGLAYWTERLDAANGNLEEILDAFGASDEADTLFGGDQTSEESVEDLYQQILGRAADEEGLEFYSSRLDSGEYTLIDVAKRIVDGIQAGSDDAEILANKVTAAQAFTDAIEADADVSYAGDDAAAVARTWLSTVDGDADNLTAALDDLSAQITDITPQNVALAVGTQTITGSSVDDTFTAVTSSLSTAKTLDVTDKVTGGSGADQLSVSVNANFTGFTTGSVSGVETVALTNAGTTARSFDMTGFSGVTAITVDASKASISLADMPTGVESISVSGQEDGTFTADFATNAAEVTGAADEITLNLSDVGTSDDTVTIDIQSIEIFNIVASGTNVIKFDGSNVEEITVSGDGDLTIEDVGSGITAFDASAATGDITVDLTDATASALKTEISTGSGDDSVTFDENGDGPSNAKFNLGDGDDTLNLNSNGGTVEYTLAGVETLAIGTTSTATLIFSGRKTTGLTEVSTTSAATTGLSLVNMGASDLTLTAIGSTANVAVTSDGSGNITVGYEKTATATATSTATPAADYTFANATGTLTVNVGANTNPASSTITANKASAVVVNVASKVSSSTEYTILGATTITANKAESIEVNASGKLDGATIASTDATSATIVASSTATGQDLVLNTPDLTDLTVTTAADLDLSASTLSDLQVLDITANKGTVTLGNLTDVTTIDLSGAGTTSKVVLGDLGATTNEYDLTITASGLEANLQIGNISIGDGYDVSISADGLDGALTVGTIAAASSEGDDVTITAIGIDEAVSIGAINADGDVSVSISDAGSTVAVGNITAAGSVTVDLSNAADAATLGSISGSALTIDISGSASGSSVDSTYTVKTSADLTLNDLEANTVNITAKTGSTGLTVTVVGGIGDDAISVTGISTSKSVTISGDLSASSGNDTLVISTIASTSAQTINFSALEGYETARVDSGNGADTIVGGAGADTIVAGQGADSITGGAGDDVFIINTADSKVGSYDTITDLEEGDVITWGDGDVVVAGDEAAGAGKAKVLDGIATFAHLAITEYDTLAEMVDLVETSLSTGEAAYFEYLGSTFLVIDTGSATSEIVVKLVGFTLPTTVDGADSGTGLTGVGG